MLFWYFQAGYAIKIVGHSLGGCVGALLSYMLLRADISSSTPINRTTYPSAARLRNSIAIDAALNGISSQCVAYGSPSCVDASMSQLLASRCGVINVVNHDDVLCRITPGSLRYVHVLFYDCSSRRACCFIMTIHVNILSTDILQKN
jgi:hypothetical protein